MKDLEKHDFSLEESLDVDYLRPGTKQEYSGLPNYSTRMGEPLKEIVNRNMDSIDERFDDGTFEDRLKSRDPR